MFRISIISSVLLASLGSMLLGGLPLCAEEPRLLADIFPGPDSGLFDAPRECAGGPLPNLPIPAFFLLGERDGLFMKAEDGATGAELWTVGGTSDHLMMVADLLPGPGSALGRCPTRNATLIDGVLYLTADDGIHGPEPWRSDGTAAGTALLADLNPGAGGSTTGSFIRFGEQVYFFAGLSAADRGIWRTDHATGAMTEQIFSTGGGLVGAAPVFGATDYLLFTVGVPSGLGSILELWRTDGTEAGTFELHSSGPTLPLSRMGGFVAFSTYTYYFVQDQALMLRRTDGLVDELVAEVLPSAGHSSVIPNAAWVVDEQILFFVPDGSSHELWRSDGTATGTESLGLAPFDAVLPAITSNLGGRLLVFAARTPEHGLELWRSDGTPEGTRLLADQVPGPEGSVFPWRVEERNGRILIARADDFAQAPNLFAVDTDGTLNDLGPLCPMRDNCAPIRPALVRGDLIYAASDPEHGREPWIRENVGFAGLPIPTVGSVGLTILAVLLATFGLAGLFARG